jgi:hypothetical protein
MNEEKNLVVVHGNSTASAISIPPEFQLGVVEPDYFIGYRRRPQPWRRWLRLLRQLVQLAIVGAILFAVPDFTVDVLHTWKNPVIIFALVCYLGKILIDTLFYDHYLP